MYERFYGLSQPAFSPTPDPDLLWPSESHQEGLATLLYGIQYRKGFLLLTGDVGVGKTTLLRAALDTLPQDVAVALVLNTHALCPDDLLEMVMRELKVAGNHRSRTDRLYALADHLMGRFQRGLNTVLIVDEAQNLDAPLLEEIRLLSNFESASEKLIQIVLCGQPELCRTLELPVVRPLRQRIALEHHLSPLTEADTGRYMSHRITVAGGRFDEIFKPGAEAIFHSASQGYPRLINVLADRVLVTGFARQQRPISLELVGATLSKLENARLAATS